MKEAIRNLVLVICLGLTISSTVLTSGCVSQGYKAPEKVTDDAAITWQVKSNLQADHDVSDLDVRVQAYRGQVQLSGFANNLAQKNRVEQIARDVKGVQSVKNDIIVK